MKRFDFRILIALITLTIGVGIVAILYFHQPLPKIALPQYPPGCSSDSDAEIINNSGEEWRTEFLARFQELPLTDFSYKADESYRLIWIPTFDSPTVIRVWRSGDEYFIVTKRLHRNINNLEIGKLVLNQTRSITKSEWIDFVNLTENGCFWKVPTNIEEIIGNDGASWIFEGYSNGEYHLLDRSNPSNYMIEIYRNLFKMTKIEMEYEDYL